MLRVLLSIHTLQIALQFPDELLCWSVSVLASLQQACPDIHFLILADTSYGSCCVDEVAALHAQVDFIVHYGHACLTPYAQISDDTVIFDQSSM